MVLPTKERRVSHLGQFWNTDTPEQRRAVLEGGHKIPSKDRIMHRDARLILRLGPRSPMTLRGSDVTPGTRWGGCALPQLHR